MPSLSSNKLAFVAAGAALGALFVVAAQHAFGSSTSTVSGTRPASPLVAITPGATTHIVLFQYTPSTSFAERSEIATAFIALREACVHPPSHPHARQPYILNIDGGVNDSPEDRKWDHAFILTFANSSDRDYYISTDPAHMAFKASLGGRVATAAVADFGAGEFTALAAKAGAKKGRRPSDEGIHVRRI